MTLWRWKAPLYSFARRLPPAKQLLAAEKKNLLQLLQQFPPSRGCHLDLGSGTGDSLQILPFEEKRIAVDAEWAMLRRNPSSRRVAARTEALPFSDESSIFISAIGLLEYIEEIDLFFSEVRRVLLPGGIFLFTSSQPNMANRLRWLWGEKLYFQSEQQIGKILQTHGWRILGHRCSLLQEQWLAERNTSPH